MKKILLIGLLGGVVLLAVGMLTSAAFHAAYPSLKTEIENPVLFRAYTDPLMSLYFVHPFLMSIILAWIWTRIKSVIVSDSEYKKGIHFGLVFWCASSLPGMLISYASFPLSLMMIVSWTTSSLLEMLCLGVLFSKTLK